MHQAGNHDLPLVPGYVLDRVLGEGGMGHVYLGTSPSGRAVAVKVIRAAVADDPAFRSRFRQEVDAARQVSGAFTAPVIDADPDAPTPWMVTQYIAGPPLDQRVKAGPPLRAEELRQLAGGLAEALRDIHRAGIVHRDLKPSNILFRADGRPVIVDFGLAKDLGSDTILTFHGKLLATPRYMSPEQCLGKDVDTRSDIYSLGVVVYEMLTGKKIYDKANVGELVSLHINEPSPRLPEPLAIHQALLDKMLAKNPDERFQNAAEVCAALGQ
jgi:serine/threonine protein kinase